MHAAVPHKQMSSDLLYNLQLGISVCKGPFWWLVRDLMCVHADSDTFMSHTLYFKAYETGASSAEL